MSHCGCDYHGDHGGCDTQCKNYAGCTKPLVSDSNERVAREIVLQLIAESFPDLSVSRVNKLTRRIVDSLAEVELISPDA